jgi:Secretion system C-terminal sorting domain
MRYISYIIVLFILAGSVMGHAQVSYDVEELSQKDISKSVQIFPNPAVEFVNVRMEHLNLDHVTVSMHNIIGNEIKIEMERIDEHEIRIKVKDFDAGYYLLALKDEQAKFRGTYKFLKR